MNTSQNDQPEITVNGRPIPQQLLDELLGEHPQGDTEAGLKEVATALVIRELLLQQAEATGLAEDTAALDDAAMDTLIDTLLDRDVPARDAEADEVERYYRANEDKFVAPPAIEMRHILLACEPEDVAARQQASLEASGLLGQLLKGADFGQLAMAHSACPSKEQGGALGQISAGQTVPEFEQQVFALAEGLCEDAIETRFGYHIVHVDRRVEGQPIAFEEAREHIANFLRDAVRHEAIRHYLQGLCAEADIIGIDLDLQDEAPPR